MAATGTDEPLTAMSESCMACGRDTPHDVHVELRTESEKERTNETSRYSREPYRVSTCLLCGEERELRMNNA